MELTKSSIEINYLFYKDKENGEIEKIFLKEMDEIVKVRNLGKYLAPLLAKKGLKIEDIR